MADLREISVALSSEAVATIEEAIEAGEYASASEVVRDALRDWRERCARRSGPGLRTSARQVSQYGFRRTVTRFRYFPAGTYLILYREIEDGVEIVRYVHGRRKLQDLV